MNDGRACAVSGYCFVSASIRLGECFKTRRERKTSDFCSDRGANFERYPQEITLEICNEEPDKKRRFTPRLVLKHSPKSVAHKAVTIGLVSSAAANRLCAATIKVTDYGAAGNGSTDDTGAIQNAINNCPAGGTVLFPAGAYKLSATLTLKSNCTYSGQGNPRPAGLSGLRRRWIRDRSHHFKHSEHRRQRVYL